MIIEAFETYQRLKSSSSKNDIKKELMNLGYKDSTSSMLVNTIFPGLEVGNTFKRSLSTNDFDVLLSFLKSNSTSDDFLISLVGFRKHIEYLRTKKKPVPAISLGIVYDKYNNELSEERRNKIADKTDEVEQEEIILTNRIQDRNKLIELLKNAKPGTQEKIDVKGKSYKRNNYIIALIKILRGQACQICKKTIMKKTGNFYIEAAHIVAKKSGGNELPSNIILLCPNHHKEFDLGDSEVLTFEDSSVTIRLGESKHTINLSFE